MNLKTDFAFKRLFGTEQFKHILIKFLNILFKKDGLHVDDVVYHDKEVLPPDPNGKRIVYDVYCTSVRDHGEEHFIVEMQQVYHSNFEKRVMYYLSNALAAQGKRGRCITWTRYMESLLWISISNIFTTSSFKISK